jgi:hypothetical protein
MDGGRASGVPLVSLIRGLGLGGTGIPVGVFVISMPGGPGIP